MTDGTMPPEFDCQCTLHWRSTFDKPNASMQPPGKTSAELTVNGNAQDPIVAVCLLAAVMKGKAKHAGDQGWPA